MRKPKRMPFTIEPQDFQDARDAAACCNGDPGQESADVDVSGSIDPGDPDVGCGPSVEDLMVETSNGVDITEMLTPACIKQIMWTYLEWASEQERDRRNAAQGDKWERD